MALLSLEEEAQNALSGLLVGTPVEVPVQLLPALVSLACSESPARTPKAGQTYAQVTLGASLVDRVSAVLSLKELDEVHLFDLLEALKTESDEPPPLWVLRLMFEHPACTERFKTRLALKYVRRSTAKLNPMVWKLLTENAGPNARAAATIASLVTSQNAGLLERMSLELASIGDSGFEMFTTLVNDHNRETTGSITINDLSELLTTTRNLEE